MESRPLHEPHRLHRRLQRRLCPVSYTHLIQGDDNADRSVRFSNYHTLISIARNDSVHSLAAKGLTGETYNDVVWWDAEVYQTPIFTQTMPETIKNVILYRYRLLDAARENARLEGRDVYKRQELKDAYQQARQRGYIPHTQFEDLYVGGMNTGWEIPGVYDARMDIKDLRLDGVYEGDCAPK